MPATSLISQIADLANLTKALNHCRRGKRESIAYQKMLLSLPDSLLLMRKELLSGRYCWQRYRQLKVFDPKERDILVASFRDRIAHQAICQVVGPMIDASIPDNSYACRKGKGNRNAVIQLSTELQRLGAERYTIKLDIRRYFESINHVLLLKQLEGIIKDPDFLALVMSLLNSHHPFQKKGRGIPIGNVTSQHFANLYLAPIDKLGAEASDVFYLRYMDDMVLCGSNRWQVIELCHQVIAGAAALSLEIPREKTVFLANAPIPFLGFVVDHHAIRPLSRNLRRHQRHLQRLHSKGARPSKIAEIETSFFAWAKL